MKQVRVLFCSVVSAAACLVGAFALTRPVLLLKDTATPYLVGTDETDVGMEIFLPRPSPGRMNIKASRTSVHVTVLLPHKATLVLMKWSILFYQCINFHHGSHSIKSHT